MEICFQHLATADFHQSLMPIPCGTVSSNQCFIFHLTGRLTYNLGKILRGGTCSNICCWCSMPVTFWRHKVCFRWESEFINLFLQVYLFLVLSFSQKPHLSIGVPTRLQHFYFCYLTYSVSLSRKGSEAWRFARCSNFDLCK